MPECRKFPQLHVQAYLAADCDTGRWVVVHFGPWRRRAVCALRGRVHRQHATGPPRRPAHDRRWLGGFVGRDRGDVPAHVFGGRSAMCSWRCLLAAKRPCNVQNMYQGRNCSDHFTCWHTEIQVTQQTFYLTQSRCTDTRSASPSAVTRTSGSGSVASKSSGSQITRKTQMCGNARISTDGYSLTVVSLAV